MKITEFGKTADGRETKLYTLENQNGVQLSVTDFGATLVRLFVPDKEGVFKDVVLGYDSAADYEAGTDLIGAVIGRNANRIKGASFELNGVCYRLTDNDNGNNLHSGTDYYHLRVWEVKRMTGDSITFSLTSPHMDQGYPGNVEVEVTYTLKEENAVKIAYYAVPDQDTVINLTNHSFFNLNGHDSGSILEQEVWVDADAFTRSDSDAIPTGEIVPVDSTPMDFRQRKPLGQDIEADYEAIVFGNGYDHNYVLHNNGRFQRVAKMVSPESGIKMEVYTDMPGMQLYTGNFITEVKGKEGAVYHTRQGCCFESQFFPDAVHHENFEGPICKKGEQFKTQTMYRFV